MPAFKHGIGAFGKRTRAYRAWTCMRNRCRNSKTPDFKYYGGRGITICERWDEFLNFLEDMGDPPLGMTLDRINTNGPYCLENCRWATRKTQAQNRLYNKISKETANQIRKLYGPIREPNESKWSRKGRPLQRELAEQFGINQILVSQIIRGTTWNDDT